MWVYIKTQAYQNNSYYQHLIEHMVLGGYSSLDRYFSSNYGVSATSWLGYTSFYLPPILKVDDFLSQIFSPLDISILYREQQMIKEELAGGSSDATVFVNRLGRQLYGRGFRWAGANARVSQKVILEQHQKFYHPEYLWICDDDFLVLSRPSSIKDNANFDLAFHLEKGAKKIRGDLYFYLLVDGSVSSYALLYFLDWILGVWGEYSSNYLGISYESKIWREFFEYERHLLLLID